MKYDRATFFNEEVKKDNYIIWWVNEDFKIDYYFTEATNEHEAIIDFFTHGADPKDVKNFRIEEAE